MKAIICPQCSASLEDILIEKNIARCDYCRATILIEQLAKKENKIEVSLLERTENLKEDKESYTKDGITYTKVKYKPNDKIRLAYISQRKSERARNFGIFMFATLLIILVFTLIFWSLVK